jgi:peptidoglycan/xylan/chitin deacetylase (PgdA/CDA1 family)
VIPAGATAALAARLAPEAGVAVLQHGYAHRNHAPAGAKQAELGPQRPQDAVLAELAAGRRRLQDLFGARLLPVLVPPWNRIDPALLPALAAQGFRGVSGYRDRPTAAQAADAGLVAGNPAVDIVDWPGRRAGGGAFVGTGAAAAAIAEQLDGGQPIGLLTHHLVHDDGCWDFLARLVALVDRHPGARWLSPEVLFAPEPAVAAAR